jgi:hypothetical protein
MDAVTLARSARESLARGLGALQTPGVPPELLHAAEPLAHAMSAMHRVESSRGAGIAEAGPAALGALRQALAQLQSAQVRHAAVDQATEAIAGALGMVHQLTALAGQASMVPSPPTKPSSQYQYPNEQPPQVAVVGQPGQPALRPHPAANPAAATQLAPSWGQQPQAVPPQPGWPQQEAQPAYQQPPQPAYQQPPQPAYQQPPQQAYPPQQAFQPPPQQAAAAAWQAPPAVPPAPAAGAKVLRYEAELGAHSPTNFYKGLSGNDVVDSGGIFIATYNIPTVGQELAIKVSMPGGYEFEALGVVRWTRDSPQSGADSSPGFGAQFTQISPDARQLVYRYVRNREPLFYDDL